MLSEAVDKGKIKGSTVHGVMREESDCTHTLIGVGIRKKKGGTSKKAHVLINDGLTLEVVLNQKYICASLQSKIALTIAEKYCNE